jgi:hypothetical protein
VASLSPFVPGHRAWCLVLAAPAGLDVKQYIDRSVYLQPPHGIVIRRGVPHPEERPLERLSKEGSELVICADLVKGPASGKGFG